jgi:16S rRNA A1518/A1519 N6-dimethyltransferase RsmA/KsgA/DIM1 with predicted DNA glycosylase/AP lyase activity
MVYSTFTENKILRFIDANTSQKDSVIELGCGNGSLLRRLVSLKHDDQISRGRLRKRKDLINSLELTTPQWL